MAAPTQTQRTEPLTPAQVEMVEKMIADRQARLRDQVSAMISEAGSKLITEVSTMISQALKPLEEQTVQYGQKIGLRLNSGKVMGVKEGGPTQNDQPVDFVSKSDVAAWESLKVERGQ